MQRLGEMTDHDATLVSDVGQHQMWLARYAGFRRPDSHLSSGGLGTMGYGLPAAMGAALGRPDKETWAVVGDGGLQMTVQEMLTTVVDHIPVKICLMDNKKLGMIRQWQEIVYGGNYHSSDLPAPQWDKLAEAYGMPTFRASSPEQVDDAIRGAQAHDGPALVWFEIEQTQNVLPMMPAGKGLSDLIEDTGQNEPPADEASDAARQGRTASHGHERPHLRAGQAHRQAALRARLGPDPPPRAGGPGQQPAGRAQSRQQHGPQPQLQHRVAGRRPHRATRHQPHDHHPPGRRLRGRADGQAALPAHRRAQGAGPARVGRRRARAGAHQGARHRVQARRDPAHHRALQGPRPRRRPETVIIEHSGTEQEIDSLVALLGGFGIKEMVRTGTIALGRGSGAIDLEAILRAGPEPAIVPTTQTTTE